jgi:TonB family protein
MVKMRCMFRASALVVVALSALCVAQQSNTSTQLEIVKGHRADYPLQASEQGIQGRVWILIHVNESGDVENAEVVSGDPILADSALRAARKWKFKPFLKDGKPIKVSTKLPFDFFFGNKVMERGSASDGSAVSDSKLVPAQPSNSDLHPDTPNSATAPAKRVRVAQGVSEGMLIRQIAPVYPPMARRNHVEGTVVLHPLIGKDGRIANLTPVSGPKELIPAAVGAVEQWIYKPYLLMGQPVEVDTQTTVNFTLRLRAT